MFTKPPAEDGRRRGHTDRVDAVTSPGAARRRQLVYNCLENGPHTVHDVSLSQYSGRGTEAREERDQDGYEKSHSKITIQRERGFERSRRRTKYCPQVRGEGPQVPGVSTEGSKNTTLVSRTVSLTLGWVVSKHVKNYPTTTTTKE